MNKKLIIGVMATLPLLATAQSAIDMYNLSKSELRGTARYMSMAGAFGALGGDISTLNQNPAGIGVYRNSDIGFTLDFDNQTTSVFDKGDKTGTNSQFKFIFNNVGYVGVYNTDSEILKNFNWGFSYNRSKSFNRRFGGNINNLQNSLSNYIAGYTNSPVNQLRHDKNFDPYVDGNAPWLSILAYNSNIISQYGDSKDNMYQGLFNDNSTGSAEFETIEEGQVDEYSINFGGNFFNKLYWGVGVGITDMYFRSYNYYGESIDKATIRDSDGNMSTGNASYGIQNDLRTTGTGYNFKMGLILKPINELRLGFAFHTPTFYKLYDRYYANSSYEYSNGVSGGKQTNDGWDGESWYQIRTPWKFIASAATIIGKRAILSFDYEYIGYQTMEALDDSGNKYIDVQNDVRNYYKSSNIFRIGGEYRVSSNFSVRVGYSYQTSPVNKNVYNNEMNVYVLGTNTAYTFDNTVSYYTAGLGYKYKNFYTDLAYVHSSSESEYHAFSPVVEYDIPSPTAKITDKKDRVALTIGFRF